ncbi:MAG: hypothetical protein HQK88_06345 [Nitrospirae bacterium]|nr:hypothetical protein [Nitrospirota bacterium]
MTRRLGNCPECGGVNTYPFLFISNNNMIYKCKKCKETQSKALPLIKKKIIYLDQFFLSKVFRKSEEDFIKASETLTRLAYYQVLVCPYSTIHETETHQWRYNEMAELFEFIKRYSRGHYFEADYEVEMTQLKRSYEAFLNGASPAIGLLEQDAVPEDVHQWDNHIFVDAGRYVEDAELVRSLKNQVVDNIIMDIDEWRKQRLSFEEIFELNVGAWEKTVKDAFKELKFQTIDNPLFLPILSKYLMQLFMFNSRGETPDERYLKMTEYMKSDYIKHIPFVNIFSKIYSLLR